MQRDTGQGLGGSRVQQSLSGSGWDGMCRDCIHQPKSSRDPWTFGGFVEVLSGRHDGPLIPSLAPLPFPQDRGGAESSERLNMVCSSWWQLAPVQEPIKSRLIRTKHTPVTQEIPKVLGALCQEGEQIYMSYKSQYHTFMSPSGAPYRPNLPGSQGHGMLWTELLTSVDFYTN